VVATAPTIGSNVEEIVYKNIKFVMWDIGGQEAVRSSWTTYYVNTHVRPRRACICCCPPWCVCGGVVVVVVAVPCALLVCGGVTDVTALFLHDGVRALSRP
jgi:hypothetical protein